jgi:uncharacterized tellurite resistance protein B-like protein
MGLFDSFRSATTPTFNLQQALMTIVVAAVKADGEVSRDEVMRIRAMCSLSPIFASNSGDQDSAVIDFADNVTSQLRDQAIPKAVQALPLPLRETAFAFACDMVLADGVLGSEEERFISALAQQCSVSDETGKAIIMTTLVRNRTAS